jgi:hypothetical protein
MANSSGTSNYFKFSFEDVATSENSIKEIVFREKALKKTQTHIYAGLPP